MKYSKDVVEARLEAFLKALEAGEEQDYQRLVKERLRDRSRQIASRNRLLEALDWLAPQRVPTNKGEWYDFAKTLAEAGGDKNSSWGLDGLINVVAQDFSGEIVKDTSKSDDLRTVIDIFKTGAPPEVSVNDLRGFNLLKIVQYGRAN